MEKTKYNLLDFNDKVILENATLEEIEILLENQDSDGSKFILEILN